MSNADSPSDRAFSSSTDLPAWDRRPWPPRLVEEWPALLTIAAVFAIGWALVGAGANVPVIDDWVYAWSVEHLLAAGRLRVLEFSAIYPIAQILWGALFARVAGVSFGVLRLSTVTLSVIASVAVYATLREMGCRRSTSLLGALALAFDPVYFALSFSFMTEVPFICASALGLYWYVRAIRRDDTRALWIGGAFSVLAFLVRPIGIALPAAAWPALVRADWRASFARRAAPLAAALVVMVGLQIGVPRVLGTLDWAAMRADYLRWWFTIPITDYLTWNINVLFVSVFPFVPLLLPFIARWRRLWRTGLAALALAAVCRLALGELSTPLPDWQTWSLQDIAARAMIGGPLGPSDWSVRVAPATRIVALLAMASLTVGLVRRRRQNPLLGTGAGFAVLTLVALHVAMIHALWLYNDRYYTSLAPLWAIVAAVLLDDEGWVKGLAAPLLAVWAAVAVTGTRDMLAFNDACARAARELEAAGVPPVEVDAGYPLNGWRLYAHPENLPPGADRRYDVPFVTSDRLTKYTVANGIEPDTDVVRLIPLERASWQASRLLYVLRRR